MKHLDILLLSAIGLSSGIVFSTFIPDQSFDAMAIIVIGLITVGFSLYRKPFFIRTLFLLTAVLGGLWLGSRDFQYWKQLREPHETLHGVARVVRPSIEKLFFQESEIRMEDCEGQPCPEEKILLRESGTQQRIPGDRLTLICDLKRPEESIEIAGRQVAYRMMLAARGIGYICERLELSHEEGRSDNGLLLVERGLFLIKEKFIAAIEGSVPGVEAALSLGMLIGADDGFSSVEKNLFVRTGVTHVTAVSGYNITVVGGLLFFLAIFFGLERRGASLLAILSIVLYVLLVGAPASAVRAGIMGAFLLLTLALGRPGSGFRVWLLALASMLAFNPLLLRYDLGFEFSYLATFALLLYASVRQRIWMPKPWFTRIFYEGMILSLFVEWLVMPLIVFQLGNVSFVSVLANMSIVLLVPLIMAFALFSGMAGIIVKGGIFLFSWPTFFLAHLFITGAQFFDALPGSFVSGVSVAPQWIALWYIVTGYLFLLFSNSGLRRLADQKAERPSV